MASFINPLHFLYCSPQTFPFPSCPDISAAPSSALHHLPPPLSKDSSLALLSDLIQIARHQPPHSPWGLQFCYTTHSGNIKEFSFMSERSPHSEPTYTDTSNSRLAQNSSTVFRNILTIAQEQKNQWLSRYFSSPIKLRVLLFYLEMLFACFMVRLLQIHKLVN